MIKIENLPEKIKAKLNPEYLAGITFDSDRAVDEFMKGAIEIIITMTLTEVIERFPRTELTKESGLRDLAKLIADSTKKEAILQIFDEKIEEYKRLLEAEKEAI